MKTVTYQIPNISCGHCVNTVKMELEMLDGVEQVEAAVDTQQAEITFQEPATEDQIKEVLAEINYPAKAS
jgi:copper chaperone CopZ